MGKNGLGVTFSDEELLQIQDYAEKSGGETNNLLRKIESVYRYCEFNLTKAIDHLNDSNFIIFENVESHEDVGRSVVSAGQFGVLLSSSSMIESGISKELERSNLVCPSKLFKYLNFEAIGQDFLLSGGIFYEDLKIVVKHIEN